MYKSKIFLECAVPTSLAILLSNKYQIIFIRALWNEERKEVKKYLYSQYNQISIYPIKFSNQTAKIFVNKYIDVIMAIDY